MNYVDKAIAISRAYDRGNCANASETTHISRALAKSRYRAQDTRHAFVLGFYSSYELHEIPDGWRDEYVAAVKWAQKSPLWKLTGIGLP